MAEHLRGKVDAGELSNCQVEMIQRDEATKGRLVQALGGEGPPALLFTASHGMGLPYGDPYQLTRQGALICQEWPGPNGWRGALDTGHFLSAEDVGDNSRLLGIVAIFFACYGARTPQLDEFSHQAFKAREAIAPHA